METSEQKRIAAYVALIQVADAIHGSVSSKLSRYDLTATQFSTLKVLGKHGAMPQRDIAKYILKSEGNITYVVDQLEAKGLVVRDRDLEDRRQYQVRLTIEGRERFEACYPAHKANIALSLGQLSDEDCEIIAGLLGKIDVNQVGTQELCAS